MTKYKHLITIKEYCDAEGIEYDDYWIRWLGQVIRTYHRLKYPNQKPPTITRQGSKGKGYDPVVDKDIFVSTTACYRIAKKSKASQSPVTQ